MARPKKQTVDYFPHDANASNGKTLFILESKFSNDGYAFWFKLLEVLSSTNGHVYDCRNPASWEFLLAKTHISEDIANKIMELLVSLDAIDKDLWRTQKVVWVQNLVDNVADVYKNRRTGVPQKPSFYNQKPPQSKVPTSRNPSDADVSTDENPQSKLKESKVKETKEDAPAASFIAYKEKLRTTFPELDIDVEWERCQIWYRDHKKAIKSPSLALGNWCGKEREIRAERHGKDRRYTGERSKKTTDAQRLASLSPGQRRQNLGR